jgi:fructosamine-3-kinase
LNNVISTICDINNLKAVCSGVVRGGDISKAFYVETSEKRLFVKVNNIEGYARMFTDEAAGLKELSQATSLKVPQVLAVGEVEGQQYLLLEWLEQSAPSFNFWEDFAQGLIQLHQTTNVSFGGASSNYIGSMVQQNKCSVSWAAFYADYRIIPLAIQLLTTVLLKRDM